MRAVTGPVRLAIVNDYEIVVSGLAAMLEGHRDRVHVVEINAQTPVLSDVDVVLVDTFGQPRHQCRDRRNRHDLVRFTLELFVDPACRRRSWCKDDHRAPHPS